MINGIVKMYEVFLDIKEEVKGRRYSWAILTLAFLFCIVVFIVAVSFGFAAGGLFWWGLLNLTSYLIFGGPYITYLQGVGVYILVFVFSSLLKDIFKNNG